MELGGVPVYLSEIPHLAHKGFSFAAIWQPAIAVMFARVRRRDPQFLLIDGSDADMDAGSSALGRFIIPFLFRLRNL